MHINAFYRSRNPIFFLNLVRYYPCGEARVNRAQSRYGVELNVLSPNTTIVTKRTLSRKQKEFAMTNKTWITGFSRIGENRELKKALELFWKGKSSKEELESVAKELRKKHWLEQKTKGVEYISSNDFSFYDHVLDTAVMLNAIPSRFQKIKDPTTLYFSMARGSKDAQAMEMTKWFNTNYHYIVPELSPSISFKLNAEKIIKEYNEAFELGIKTKINLIGPLTFLSLCKTENGEDPFTYLDSVLCVYKELLAKMAKLQANTVLQFEEPIFVRNPSSILISKIASTYQSLCEVSPKNKIAVVTYFEHATEAVKELSKTDVWGIGLDFVYGSYNMSALSEIRNKKLIVGLVDGRNVWANDYEESLDLLEKISAEIPKENMIVSTAASLLHCPYSLKGEPHKDLYQWFSFGVEKIVEVVFLSELFFSENRSEKNEERLNKNKQIFIEKRRSRFITDDNVQKRMGSFITKERSMDFNARYKIQREKFNLPLLPTTTIGSFPQTAELRQLRRDYKNNTISKHDYETQIKAYIDECVALQEEIGLDVLVHGEPERNDMVEYFGELMQGFLFTQKGWVQSYGSRCVKPPIIYGDVSRPYPMTVPWISYAQSKTSKKMKGMLTGPVTIINWSFVRNDISRAEVAKQIAMALSDEIVDLQKAGISIIQVDEAAFKEGYPLRKEKVQEYENWAVESFKMAVSVAAPETQIHTHMCYSDFNDIIHTIESMDADVITIETARSGNKLLEIFKKTHYEHEIGPGVYDIHSPRIPSVEEFETQIKMRLEVLSKDKMWVNPDCGLKTRSWDEVKPALKNMVQAADNVRRSLK